MVKKLLFILLLLGTGNTLFGQEYYLTLKVTMAFKNKTVLHRMIPDAGTDMKHPMKGKIEATDANGIKITEADGKTTIFTNEVDVLNYLAAHGWKLISVNEVSILEDKYLQYLFKTEN